MSNPNLNSTIRKDKMVPLGLRYSDYAELDLLVATYDMKIGGGIVFENHGDFWGRCD